MEGEAVGVADKLKALAGISPLLLQQRQKHKLIRNSACHGGYLLRARPERGASAKAGRLVPMLDDSESSRADVSRAWT